MQLSDPVEVSRIPDPEARHIAAIERLRAIQRMAANRLRTVKGGKPVYDPDGNTILKAEEMVQRLIREGAERRGDDVPGSADQTRAEAIAELRATLAVWEDPTITDEQWAASRWKPKPPKQGGGATKKPRRNPL